MKSVEFTARRHTQQTTLERKVQLIADSQLGLMEEYSGSATAATQGVREERAGIFGVRARLSRVEQVLQANNLRGGVTDELESEGTDASARAAKPAVLRADSSPADSHACLFRTVDDESQRCNPPRY